MKDYILDLDKPRELRYGFKANRLIRQKFGEKSLESLVSDFKVDDMPALVWAGLKWEDNALTVEQLEDLLDEAIPKKYTILGVIEEALEALVAHMGADLKKVKADASEAIAEMKTKAEKPKTVTEEKPQPKRTTLSTKKRKK